MNKQTEINDMQIHDWTSITQPSEALGNLRWSIFQLCSILDVLLTHVDNVYSCMSFFQLSLSTTPAQRAKMNVKTSGASFQQKASRGLLLTGENLVGVTYTYSSPELIHHLGAINIPHDRYRSEKSNACRTMLCTRSVIMSSLCNKTDKRFLFQRGGTTAWIKQVIFLFLSRRRILSSRM